MKADNSIGLSNSLKEGAEMRKKVVWLVVSGWMVAALLLAFCAPAVVEEEKVVPKEEVVTPKAEVVPKEVVVPREATNLVKWTGKKLDGTVVEKMIEKPRYGGVYITANDVEPASFDNGPLNSSNAWAVNPVNEQLLTKDLTRGPQGTHEWSADLTTFAEIGHETGILAESWELAEPGTLVFHIRKGVSWQDKPPLNGRQLTADDVVFSMRRTWTKGNYVEARTPNLIDPVNRENSIYVSPTDKWAVVLKFQPAAAAGTVYQSATDHQSMVAPEVVEKYGDQQNWRNVVGTGPFILKSYVGASSLTYIRNDTYWRHDPFFPENQLPYIDTLKVFIMPDMSTRLAALRTGKVDMLDELTADDAEPLMKSNPKLERYTRTATNLPGIYMMMGKPELPWADIRVRRALMMAIDHQKILDDLYEGKGVLSNYPIAPVADFMAMYVPLEQMSQSIRELFEYHPDKARQLLAEAGYPAGFKTEVITKAADVDLLSIVKRYWADIGVDLNIEVRDATAHTTIGRRKSYLQMYMGSLPSPVYPYTLTETRPGTGANYSNVNDPKTQEVYEAMNEVFFDVAKRQQILKDFVPYIKEQAWRIELPAPDVYILWQPWLKNFYGVTNTSHGDTLSHPVHVWIDQELKKTMGR